MGTKFETHAQRAEREANIRDMEKVKSNSIAWSRIEDKQAFDEALNSERKELEAKSPPEEVERKKLMEREALLAQAMIHGDPSQGIEPMPSVMRMNKAPTGAVGQCLRWNNFVKNYTIDPNGKVRRKRRGEQGLVFEWKDIRRSLYKELEAEYPDIASIEGLRPEVEPGESRLINYARATFAPGASLSVEEYQKATGYEPNEKDRGIYESMGVRFCQAVNKDGTKCSRLAKDGYLHCGKASHAQQFHDGEHEQ